MPAFDLIVTFLVFQWALFENQRWVRARLNGMRGSSEVFGFFVDTTLLIGMIFQIIFYISYAVDFGILSFVSLFLILLVLSLASEFFVITPLLAFFFRGDSALIWMIGTIGVWVTIPFLIPYTTWFGLG